MGAELLRHWHFPDFLLECVEFHHAPEQARKYPLETAHVHIANSIATLAEIDSVAEEDVLRTDPAAWAVTGLGKDAIEPTVRAIQAQFSSMRNLLA